MRPVAAWLAVLLFCSWSVMFSEAANFKAAASSGWNRDVLISAADIDTGCHCSSHTT